MSAADTGVQPFFISFEGGEGAGKTTQIARAAEWLRQRGHDVHVTREPGGTKEAEALRRLFLEEEGGPHWPLDAQCLLMFTARSLHVRDIRDRLAKGQTVLSDRFTDSTRAYQGLALGLGLERVEAIRAAAIGDFEPDLTILLDIDPEAGLARTKGRGEQESFEALDLDFHKALRAAYLEIAKRHRHRFEIVAAGREAEAVAADIARCLEERVG